LISSRNTDLFPGASNVRRAVQCGDRNSAMFFGCFSLSGPFVEEMAE